MTPQELLNQAGISLPSYATGNYTLTCPQCSATRQPRHQKYKCLGVKIDDQGATWHCCHCEWSGPEKGTNQGNGHDRSFAATYDYHDADGVLRFQKVRNLPGSKNRFFVRRPDGAAWINDTKGVDTNLLYRLPEVIEAIAQGHTILVVEGEKDADNLWRIGIPATCNAHGASEPDKNPKWKIEHSEQLRGADIVVIPDHDPAGYAHADTACCLSLSIAKRVRKLELAKHWPECPKGGDISNWLEAKHTREQLDALIEQAPDYQRPNAAKRNRPLSAKEIRAMKFEPIKAVVPGIIVEGLSLLAGKPKVGKSWLLLHAALAVARGGFTLGDIHCPEGDVLYCALEDNWGRLNKRLTKLLGTQDTPERCYFLTELPRLNDGGLVEIKNWIASAKHPRLVIIDTLAMVRTPPKHNQTAYAADYDAVKDLREFAAAHGVAVVLVHHLRKQDADDAFDTISGTLGLTGAVDSALVIRRETNGFVLHARGRDLPELEKAMQFNADACTWRIIGNAADVRASEQRRSIIAAMQEIGEPAPPNKIAQAAQLKPVNVRKLLARMVMDGEISRSGHKYTLVSTPQRQPDNQPA
jgi:DNA primase